MMVENSWRSPGGRERLEARAQDSPSGKLLLEFAPSKKIIVVPVEHAHVCSTLNEHVDAARPPAL